MSRAETSASTLTTFQPSWQKIGSPGRHGVVGQILQVYGRSDVYAAVDCRCWRALGVPAFHVQTD